MSTIIFGLLLISFCIGGFVVYKERETLFGGNVVKEDPFEKRYSLILQANHQGYPIDALYQLMEGSIIVQGGNISVDRYEVFSQARKDTIYTLVGYRPEYYLNSTTCEWNSTLCSVSMDKVANPFITFAQTGPEEATIFITIEEGTTIHTPLFCFSYGYTITHLTMPLERVQTPSHIKETTDMCFISREDIRQPETQWEITFKKMATDGIIEFTLLDQGYNDYLEAQYEEGNMPDIVRITPIK